MATATTTARAARNGSAKAKNQATVTIETVTPAKARKWLEANLHNRYLRDARVENYAAAMARGEWTLSPDALAFDQEDVLLNGQHRLAAVEASNSPQPFIILRGLPTITQEVTDQGLTRSTADALRLRGHHNWFTLAAALGWLYRLGYIKRTGSVHYASPSMRPTTPQLLRLLGSNKGLIEAIKKTASTRIALKLPSGLTAALYHSFAKLNAEEAEIFFEKLRTGEGLHAGDPIFVLRRFMVNDMGAVTRMKDYRRAALICKAWNAWREGKHIQTLTWHYSATQKEAFPFPS